MTQDSVDQAIGEVAEALSAQQKAIITCHVKPDGDAIGCCIALHLALGQRGADSIIYMADSDPFSPEYAFLTEDIQIVHGDAPADHAKRTLITLDCGNAERIGNDELVQDAPRIINIDHHVDNSRFGDINVVIPSASSTAEILYFVLQKMETNITPEIARALYTGILVDSGRFQYEAASAATFRVAADLMGRGVDHTDIFRRVYENMPLAKAKLLCRMLASMRMLCDGRLAVGILDEQTFRDAGAGAGLTEGLVDNLRAIEGVEVAALIYARLGEANGTTPHYRVSLRSSSGEDVNVQKIAGLKGGGGHTQAAGFTADETPDQLVEFLADAVASALAASKRSSAL